MPGQTWAVFRRNILIQVKNLAQAVAIKLVQNLTDTGYMAAKKS